MIKEELYKEAEEYVSKYQGYGGQPHRGSATFEAMLDCYIHGAEPREKRIAELEQTNKQISNECHKLVDTLEKKQKEIEELKKENAELKSRDCWKSCEYANW